jgi:DNA-binding transcriptional MerR regulator
MEIGIIAKKVGLSVDAIGFYERNALLPRPNRTQGGFRQYGERDVETRGRAAEALRPAGIATDGVVPVGSLAALALRQPRLLRP